MTADQRLAVVALCAGAALAIAPAARAQAPAGPPGPPPGNGTALPAPPGTAPPFVPPGTAMAVPAGSTGPGRLSGESVRLDRRTRRFALRLACAASGRITFTARGVGGLGSARFHCAGDRTTARLKLSKKTARKVAHRRTVAATAAIGARKRISFNLTTRAVKRPPAGFWTDGHLQCTADDSGAPPAYLVEPDFTTAQTTPISTRGWVAWYTARAGWHWLGGQGEDAGAWNAWTATPTGIAQFHPGGAVQPIPYTAGPISAPAGEQIYLAGVYEIVYWVGGRPQYRWQYVNAGSTGAAAAGASTPYCAYP